MGPQNNSIILTGKNYRQNTCGAKSADDKSGNDSDTYKVEIEYTDGNANQNSRASRKAMLSVMMFRDMAEQTGDYNVYIAENSPYTLIEDIGMLRTIGLIPSLSPKVEKNQKICKYQLKPKQNWKNDAVTVKILCKEKMNIKWTLLYGYKPQCNGANKAQGRYTKM